MSTHFRFLLLSCLLSLGKRCRFCLNFQMYKIQSVVVTYKCSSLSVKGDSASGGHHSLQSPFLNLFRQVYLMPVHTDDPNFLELLLECHGYLLTGHPVLLCTNMSHFGWFSFQQFFVFFCFCGWIRPTSFFGNIQVLVRLGLGLLYSFPLVQSTIGKNIVLLKYFLSQMDLYRG